MCRILSSKISFYSVTKERRKCVSMFLSYCKLKKNVSLINFSEMWNWERLRTCRGNVWKRITEGLLLFLLQGISCHFEKMEKRNEFWRGTVPHGEWVWFMHTSWLMLDQRFRGFLCVVVFVCLFCFCLVTRRNVLKGLWGQETIMSSEEVKEIAAEWSPSSI